MQNAISRLQPLQEPSMGFLTQVREQSRLIM
uniref:Uncharacterized protein n=1 Tax=Anguilla anguilla TaxID=7936 RepID=A0A0E9PIV8_ANGAN